MSVNISVKHASQNAHMHNDEMIIYDCEEKIKGLNIKI